MADRSSSLSAKRYRVYFAVQTGVLLTVLDMTAAYVATPFIAAELGVGLAATQWVLSGYLLTIAMLLVPAGRLSDSLGRKNLFVGGYVLKAVGAMIAWQAGTIEILVAARVMMGIGSATVQATSMPIIVSAFDPADRGKVLGTQMGIVGIGTVLGPVIGGLVVELYGWRMAFLGVGIVSFFVVALSARVLEPRGPDAERSTRPFDYTGSILLGLAMLTLMLTLTSGIDLRWSHPIIVSGFICAFALMVAFVFRERHCAHPLIELGMLRSPAFSLGMLIAFVGFMGTSSAYYLVPFFLKFVGGFGPEDVGLALMPAGFMTAILAPLAGHTGDRFGHRPVATAGLAALVTGLLVLSVVTATSSTMLVTLAMAVVASGLAFFHAPNSSAIFDDIRSEDFGVTSGSINLSRNMGNVVGIAIATTVVTSTMSSRGFPTSLASMPADSDSGLLLAFADGVSSALLLFAGLCSVLIVLSIMLLKRGRQTDASPG